MRNIKNINESVLVGKEVFLNVEKLFINFSKCKNGYGGGWKNQIRHKSIEKRSNVKENTL